MGIYLNDIELQVTPGVLAHPYACLLFAAMMNPYNC